MHQSANETCVEHLAHAGGEVGGSLRKTIMATMFQPRDNGSLVIPRIPRVLVKTLDSPLAFVPFTFLLIVMHADTLTLPPPHDQCLGIWNEGSYLYETRFDFPYLWRHGQYCSVYGERPYIMSILPSLLAILYFVTGSSLATIIGYKLVILTCGGFVGAIVYQFSQRWISRLESLLLSLTVLTIPLFSCQLDLVGMELPVTVPILLGIQSAVDQRMWTSFGWFSLASAIKLIAIVPTIAVLLVLLISLFVGFVIGMRAKRAIICTGVTIAFFLLSVLQGFLFVNSGQGDPQGQQRPTGPRLHRAANVAPTSSINKGL